MRGFLTALSRLFVLPVAFVSLSNPSLQGSSTETALAAGNPVEMIVEELDGSQFIYVVFHALDRDGFCSPPAGAVSLHPVLNMPVDFIIEAGDGIVIETSAGSTAPGRGAHDVPTFSTRLNAALANPVRSFPPLVDGLADECQAWIKVSQSIPGPLRVLVTVPGDNGGTIGLVADLERETVVDMTLSFRWTLITWLGEDAVNPGAALKGPGASDISDKVTAIYGWDAGSQTWLAYFPAGTGVPGANNLGQLKTGSAYWVAIAGPADVTWSVTR